MSQVEGKKFGENYEYIALEKLQYIDRVKLENFVIKTKDTIRKSSRDKRKPFIITVDAGGTISMEYEESHFESGQELIAKEQDYEGHIRKLVPPHIADPYKFFNFPAFSLDSSDIGLNHVAEMVTAVSYMYSELSEIPEAPLQGVVVCIGTDRMAESSTRFAFQMGKNLPIPIVFTGAQISMGEAGSDAPQNVTNSIAAITQMSANDKAEVLTCFGANIHRSVGTEKIDAVSLNGINSRLFEPIGKIQAGTLYELADWARTAPVNNGKTKIFKPRPIYSSTDALSLLALPELDMNFDVSDITEAIQDKVGGILMPTFASGTVNTGAMNKLKAICEKEGKLLVVANHTAPHIESQYSSAQEVRESDNIIFATMSRHALIAKFQQLCAENGNDLEKVAKKMINSSIGEIPNKTNRRTSPIVL